MLFNDTTELIEQVRALTDEANTVDITDATVIRQLNRAQQELVRILTKRYPSMMMQEVRIQGSAFTENGRVAEMPDRIFANSVNQVDASQGTTWLPVRQTPFHASLSLDVDTTSNVPLIYAVQGRKLYVYPKVDPSTEIRVRYQNKPLPLGISQGRVISFDESAQTVTLDALGSDLSTDVDSLAGFVNIVDPLTGDLKATLQLAGIDTETNTLTFKTTSLDRTSVFGRTVGSDLTGLVALDDLVSLASVTPVPFLMSDLDNYLIEYAAYLVKRAMNTQTPEDTRAFDEMKRDIGAIWSGREATWQIKRKRRDYPGHIRSFFRGNS